jgi:hypothetical protein
MALLLIVEVDGGETSYVYLGGAAAAVLTGLRVGWP